MNPEPPVDTHSKSISIADLETVAELVYEGLKANYKQGDLIELERVRDAAKTMLNGLFGDGKCTPYVLRLMEREGYLLRISKEYRIL